MENKIPISQLKKPINTGTNIIISKPQQRKQRLSTILKMIVLLSILGQKLKMGFQVAWLPSPMVAIPGREGTPLILDFPLGKQHKK